MHALLRVVENVVGKRGRGVWIQRGEGGDVWGPIIHFKGRGAGEGFVGHGVIGETDALGERRP